MLSRPARARPSLRIALPWLPLAASTLLAVSALWLESIDDRGSGPTDHLVA
jgi:hypothetical protein